MPISHFRTTPEELAVQEKNSINLTDKAVENLSISLTKLLTYCINLWYTNPVLAERKLVSLLRITYAGNASTLKKSRRDFFS